MSAPRPTAPDTPPTTLDNEAHWRRLRTLSLLVLAFIAVGMCLEATSSVMLPIVIAAFVSFVVTPIVDHIQVRMKWPRPIAVLAATLAVVGGFSVLGGLMSASVRSFASKADFYEQKINELVQQGAAWLADMGVDLGSLSSDESGPLFKIAQGVATDAVGIVGNLVLVMILTLYLVAARSPERKLDGLWGAIEHTMRQYMAVKLLTSAATGTICGILLWAFGVDLALAFGVLTFLLNFVPTVGSIVATALPLPFALVLLDGGTVAVLAALLILVQQVVGNVLEPKLMGEGLDLHPVTILVSLSLWGLIFGIVGMLLSAPLTAVVKIILARDPTTKPMAEFLAGRLNASEPADPDGPATRTS